MTPIKQLLLVSVCALAISGCHSSAEKAQAYLTKGIDYYKQGDNAKARVELKNVIQLDNKQADAFYYLALVDEKDQNWGGMFNNLKQAIALKPQNNEARIKLAKIYFSEMNDESFAELSTKVIEQLDAVLKVSANDPAALTLKAGLLFKQHKLDEATVAVDALLKAQPDFPDALNLKANIYVVKNDLPSALAIANKAIMAKPDELSFYILKLQIHDKAVDKAAIEQDYLQIIKQFPEKLEFNYMLAQFYSRTNQEDKATKILQETINKNPTEIMPKLTFIDYLLLKNRSQVEATIKSYLTQHSNDPELLFRLANFYLQENKPAEAKQQLNVIISAKKDSKEALDAKLLLAELALPEDKSPKHEAVSAMLKDILAVNPLHLNALILKTKITLNNGLYDEGIAELRSILTNYPKADQAMVLLGEAYIMKKSPELAEESFYKALEANPSNIDALKPILSKLMQSKDYIRAAELVQKGLAVKSNNLQLLKTLAQIKLSAADWAEVKKIADVFATLPKEVAFYNYLSGRILQNDQKYAEAIVKYEEVLAASPEFLEAMDGIIQSNEKLNKRSATFAYLDSYIKAHPDKAFIYLIKAELLMADKQKDLAVKTLTDAIAKWPKNLPFYMNLAKFYTLSKETDQAIAVYNKALVNVPDSVDVKMTLAGVYEQKQDYANALKLYESLLNQHPELEIVANNIASLLLDHYPTKENIARAVKLTQQFSKSENPYYLDTYAMALLSSERYDDALQALQKVIAKNSDVPVFRYHLGVAYHKTNHDTAAVGELEQALVLGEKAGEFAEKQLAQDLLKQVKK